MTARPMGPAQDSRAAFPPEMALLIAGARQEPDEVAGQRIRELAAGPLDWEQVAGQALAHGITPLLYRGLECAAADAVPPEVLAALRQSTRALAARNVFLAAELRRVLGILGGAGIAAVALKGPALAAFLYGDVHLRQFWDLDVLVRPGDARRAIGALLADGYAPRRPAGRLHHAARLRFGFEYNLARRDPAANVQLHWGLSGGGILLSAGEDLWCRLEHVSLAGAAIPVLPAEELLLYLCVHGSRHCWRRLQWICDVAQVLRRYRQMDWLRLLALARDHGCARMLHLGVLLACRTLDVEVPAALAERRLDPALEGLLEQARTCLVAGEPRPRSAAWRELGFQWRLRERGRDRLPDLAASAAAFIMERTEGSQRRDE